MENTNTGVLLNEQNIKLHRLYFKQMCQLHGIKVLYRAPVSAAKHYNGYGELDTYYQQPVSISCIWDEHPVQKTMKKLGWNAELSDATSVIHVPYDIPELQAGCLFIIPAGLDHAEARIFKVLRMTNIAIYPASIACELGPVLVNADERAATNDFRNTNFNLLSEEEDS